jgi:hypothetical protein
MCLACDQQPSCSLRRRLKFEWDLQSGKRSVGSDISDIESGKRSIGQREHELPVIDLPAAKAAENLERFRDLVRGSLELQQLLREISDREPFIDETLRTGREHGCDFNRQDIEETMQTERRKWNERWIR